MMASISEETEGKGNMTRTSSTAGVAQDLPKARPRTDTCDMRAQEDINDESQLEKSAGCGMRRSSSRTPGKQPSSSRMAGEDNNSRGYAVPVSEGSPRGLVMAMMDSGLAISSEVRASGTPVNPLTERMVSPILTFSTFAGSAFHCATRQPASIRLIT